MFDKPLFFGNSLSYCDYFWKDKKAREYPLIRNKYNDSNSFCIFKYQGNLCFIPLGSYMYELTSDILKPQSAILGEKDLIQITKSMLIEITRVELPESDLGKDFAKYLKNLQLVKLWPNTDDKHQDCVEASVRYQLWQLNQENMQLKKIMQPKEYEFATRKSYKIGKNFQVKEFLKADGVKSQQIELVYSKEYGILVKSALTGGVAAQIRMSEISPSFKKLLPRGIVLHKNIELTIKPQNSDFKSKIMFIF